MDPSKDQVNPFERQLEHFHAKPTVSHKAKGSDTSLIDLDIPKDELGAMNLSSSELKLVNVLLYGPGEEPDADEKIQQDRSFIANVNISLGIPVPEGLESITDTGTLKALLQGGSTMANFDGDINWLGSAAVKLKERAHLLSTGDMERFKSSREAIALQLKDSPYDPFIWYELTTIYRTLGFAELAVSTAHKAEELIFNGLDTSLTLSQKVLNAMITRFKTTSVPFIRDNLNALLQKVMKQKVYGLAALQCYKQGLRLAKEGRSTFQDDEEFKRMEQAFEELLHASNMDAAEAIWDKASFEDQVDLAHALREISKTTDNGIVHKRKYPWMSSDLFTRTPALLEQINRDLISVNCRVGVCDAIANTHVPPDKNDVGGLGIFATHDIQKGDVVLIDAASISSTDSMPASLELCDHCYATMQFVEEAKHIKPDCCQNVVYCSTKCLRDASATHRILCRLDAAWLYEAMGTEHRQNPHWLSYFLLRILAAILATPQSEDPSKDHPLQHPIVARLTAGYANVPDPPTKSWNYNLDVIAQHRVLRMLGIDIFADDRFSSEVMATIMWRIRNNCCTLRGFLTEIPGFSNGTKETGDILCLKQNYVFLNHSCDSNVSWLPVDHNYGKIPEDYKYHVKQFLKPEHAHILEDLHAGGSFMVCFASKNIMKGEECRISYLPVEGKSLRERRRALLSWLTDDCSCKKCTEEEEAQRGMRWPRW